MIITYKYLFKLYIKNKKLSNRFALLIEQEFDGFSREIVEELRYVALLTKGGHSLLRVENRMDILAYYVNNDIPKNTPSNISLVEL